MPQSGPLRIHYGVRDGQLFIAVDGAATYQVSVTVEHLVQKYLVHRPTQPNIAVDLNGCAFIDSTFAGWMIKLHRRLAQVQGHFTVSRCPHVCHASLHTMGLTTLFEFDSVPAPTRLQDIDSETPSDDDESLDHLLQAHEDLAHVSSHNERVFTPIAETLRKELEKRS